MAPNHHGSAPPTGEPSADQLIAGIAEFQRRLDEAAVSVRRFINSPRFMFGRREQASVVGTNACAELAKLRLWTGMLAEDVGYHTRLKDAPDKPFEVMVRDYLEQAGTAASRADGLSAGLKKGARDVAAGLSSYVRDSGPDLISKAQRVDAGLGPRDPISDVIWVAEDVYSSIRSMHKTFANVLLHISSRFVTAERYRDYNADPPVVDFDPRAMVDPTGPAAITKLVESCAATLLQPISSCNAIVMAARSMRGGKNLPLIALQGSQMATSAEQLETQWGESRRVIDHAHRLLATALHVGPDSGREARAITTTREAAAKAFTAAARQSRDVSAGVAKLMSLIRGTGDAIDSL